MPLVVADVGNSSIDFGCFPTHWQGSPRPDAVWKWDVSQVSGQDRACSLNQLDSLLQQRLPTQPCRWHVGSVNAAAAELLLAWLQQERPADEVVTIGYDQLGQPTNVMYPTQVGIDRLAAAKAVGFQKRPDHAAVIVDAGTAIKVDALSVDGQFLGGTISPGLRLSFNSLAKGTSRLPTVEDVQRPPELIGRQTTDAIHSGVYWMAVGGIQRLVSMVVDQLEQGGDCPCQVFATGGSIRSLLASLPPDYQYEPALVLTGLALAHAGDAE